MPKQFPDSIKLKAMELFLEGELTAKKIAEVVSTQEHVVSPPTIYMWARKEKWGEQKIQEYVDNQTDVARKKARDYSEIQEDQMNQYTDLATKANAEIKGLTFDRALDATRAADIAIKGQREVMQGMINMNFVNDIMAVLIDEVNDADTLQRIAAKLKSVYMLHEDS
tara:strand:- start:516 stop:1016 length:501 start_codon:yes stop_codon:yes gene_type:complete